MIVAVVALKIQQVLNGEQTFTSPFGKECNESVLRW